MADTKGSRSHTAARKAAKHTKDTKKTSAQENATSSQGVPQVNLPASSETAKTAEELRAEWQSIKDPTAKAAFYAKHKNSLTTA